MGQQAQAGQPASAVASPPPAWQAQQPSHLRSGQQQGQQQEEGYQGQPAASAGGGQQHEGGTQGQPTSTMPPASMPASASTPGHYTGHMPASARPPSGATATGVHTGGGKGVDGDTGHTVVQPPAATLMPSHAPSSPLPLPIPSAWQDVQHTPVSLPLPSYLGPGHAPHTKSPAWVPPTTNTQPQHGSEAGKWGPPQASWRQDSESFTLFSTPVSTPSSTSTTTVTSETLLAGAEAHAQAHIHVHVHGSPSLTPALSPMPTFKLPASSPSSHSSSMHSSPSPFPLSTSHGTPIPSPHPPRSVSPQQGPELRYSSPRRGPGLQDGLGLGSPLPMPAPLSPQLPPPFASPGSPAAVRGSPSFAFQARLGPHRAVPGPQVWMGPLAAMPGPPSMYGGQAWQTWEVAAVAAAEAGIRVSLDLVLEPSVDLAPEPSPRPGSWPPATATSLIFMAEMDEPASSAAADVMSSSEFEITLHRQAGRAAHSPGPDLDRGRAAGRQPGDSPPPHTPELQQQAEQAGTPASQQGLQSAGGGGLYARGASAQAGSSLGHTWFHIPAGGGSGLGAGLGIPAGEGAGLDAGMGMGLDGSAEMSTLLRQQEQEAQEHQEVVMDFQAQQRQQQQPRRGVGHLNHALDLDLNPDLMEGAGYRSPAEAPEQQHSGGQSWQQQRWLGGGSSSTSPMSRVLDSSRMGQGGQEAAAGRWSLQAEGFYMSRSSSPSTFTKATTPLHWPSDQPPPSPSLTTPGTSAYSYHYSPMRDASPGYSHSYSHSHHHVGVRAGYTTLVSDLGQAHTAGTTSTSTTLFDNPVFVFEELEGSRGGAATGEHRDAVDTTGSWAKVWGQARGGEAEGHRNRGRVWGRGRA